METSGVIIILIYVIGIILAFLSFRNKEDYNTFDKVWWSIFWLPWLIWKVFNALFKGWNK